MMFLDCPAWLDQDGTVRCGLPAEVRWQHTMCSTGRAPRRRHDQVRCRALVQRAQRIPHLGKQRQASARPCRSRCQCLAVGMAVQLTGW